MYNDVGALGTTRMIKAEVIKVKASGATVQLENGEEAWLPGVELSTLFNPAQALSKQSSCTEGDVLDVVVYGREMGGERTLVSCVRVHDDPWDKVRAWQNGEVKEMVITSVTRDKAFGQIDTGIQGYIELEELYEDKKRCRFPRSWDDIKVVAVGDAISGYVYTRSVNEKKRLVKLDVLSYITELEGISRTLPVLSDSPGESMIDTEAIIKDPTDLFIPELPEVRHMLVVDDYQQFTIEVSEYLTDCGIATAAVVSKEEAVAFLSGRDCPDLDIAVVDVHLTGDYNFEGLAVARSIREKQPRCRIILVTGDEMRMDKMLTLAGDFQLSAFLFKPFGPEELNRAISATVREKPRPLKDFFADKGDNTSKQSAVESKTRRMYSVLDDLRRRIKAQSVILFGIHPVSFNVRIVEECGDVSETLDEHLPMLRYSPVNDVGIEREKIFEPDAGGLRNYPKHRRLLDALKYESCIAYPIEVEHEWSYAVFAFHGEPHKFAEKDKSAVQAAAKELAYFIEIRRLMDTWRRETPFILAGKTYGSMAHDLIHSVSREFGIPKIFKIFENKSEIKKAEIDTVQQYLSTLLTDLKRAKGIVETFRRMSRSHLDTAEEVDVLEAIAGASKSLAVEVEELNTTVVIPSGKNEIRPTAHLRKASFEQMIYNLVLNAAQQIYRFRFVRNSGLVKIEVDEIESGGDTWIRILVHDNGPGIHAHNYGRVFEMGYTTKDYGCGMGLDICRNIAKDADGSIRILKSVLFIGTTVEILLPSAG